jgi:hypothetical protein
VIPIAVAFVGAALGWLSPIELSSGARGANALMLTFAAGSLGAAVRGVRDLGRAQTPMVAGLMSWFALVSTATLHAPRQASLWSLALVFLVGWQVRSDRTMPQGRVYGMRRVWPALAAGYLVMRGVRLFVTLPF